MPPDIITMYHPGIPGDEAVRVERASYRQTWWPLGWRSTDDPTYTGVQTEQPALWVTEREGWDDTWKASCLEAGTRLVRGVTLSDSTGVGIEANGIGTCHPTVFAAGIKAKLGDGGSGWVNHITHAIGGFGGPGDPAGARMVETGSWTNVDAAPGVVARRPTTPGAGASMTFHQVRGTIIELYVRRGSGFGSLQVSVDGDSATTHATANATADVFKFTVRTGLSDVAHTVAVTNNSGDVRFLGIRGIKATGYVEDNLSVGGASWAISSGGAMATAAEGLAGQTVLTSTLTMLGLGGPVDLLTVALGVNDSLEPGGGPNFDTIWAQGCELHARTRLMGPTQARPPSLMYLGQHHGQNGETNGRKCA